MSTAPALAPPFDALAGYAQSTLADAVIASELQNKFHLPALLASVVAAAIRKPGTQFSFDSEETTLVIGLGDDLIPDIDPTTPSRNPACTCAVPSTAGTSSRRWRPRPRAQVSPSG